MFFFALEPLCVSQPDHASRVVVFLGVNVCVGCRWKLVLLFVFTPGPFRRLRLLRTFCRFSVFSQVFRFKLQSSFSRPFLCFKVFFRVHPYLFQGNRSSRARVVALAAHAAAHPASLLLPFPSPPFPFKNGPALPVGVISTSCLKFTLSFPSSCTIH